MQDKHLEPDCEDPDLIENTEEELEDISEQQYRDLLELELIDRLGEIK